MPRDVFGSHQTLAHRVKRKLRSWQMRRLNLHRKEHNSSSNNHHVHSDSGNSHALYGCMHCLWHQMTTGTLRHGLQRQIAPSSAFDLTIQVCLTKSPKGPKLLCHCAERQPAGLNMMTSCPHGNLAHRKSLGSTMEHL